jgi:hypothetical protein
MAGKSGSGLAWRGEGVTQTAWRCEEPDGGLSGEEMFLNCNVLMSPW